MLAWRGFTQEHFCQHDSVGQRYLPGLLGVFFHGSYIAPWHADLLWPGSSNQRIHYLTDRHVPALSDRSAGAGVNVPATAVTCTGVPRRSVSARRSIPL